MGGLFSRWRAKPSTVEVLENIDKEIQALEEFREKNQRLQKLWVGRLIIYSSILYLFTCLIVYLWYLPDEFIARLVMTLPFFAFPLIIWTLRTVLIFFFSKRTERNNEALDDLKSQKKKILEEVMEKETYKTAKLILERFDPDSKKAKEFEPPSAGAAATAKPGQEIRQRTAAQRNLSPAPANSNQGPPPQVPVSPGPSKDASAPGGPPERTVAPALPRRLGSPATSVPGMGLHPPGPPLARPVLPRERGALDRIVEYLVGDGPQNRYALICQQCFSHNGMALKEEFEYIAFRCAYCFFLNPARKTRPQAPRLPEFSFEKRQAVEGSSSTGPMLLESVPSPENQLTEDSLEEQDDLDNSTEQKDDKIPVTEQTNQVIEETSGPEGSEENQEETENEETSTNEAKSPVLRSDSVSNLELSEDSVVTK
ncbi:limb and neural patterns (predicted), isoform CRA_b [Rattus norvegicus]|uniref:Endoplasmic reticulum junction formation protein lunapark n=3 Tax=Rattus norvegicus TaxID=10116 RepID=A6HMC2_RAT|nr:endoplasmic reticulum junction formation protein lunapark isoform X1 [Rattus norvegicus]XP_006234440.1 endoplasmic reticulum junction formation protein lunapark isoform X1 [Rattus norvegicus]XP_006234441.1 endoplasmic reticulum junction formation protein lunapark isoform X1 [Rattus norvegicus]XP_006234442.1 endoplasmic reticulum junction formation protein lunapark isoform X1 [Rattus norvegicus]XP_006234443.1 endoplasmic reticulum junction formation protein lunapark isoform X1 [Rattus norvegi|eukprot:XP_006234439.1 PREDICTED: protein lunapark isoform X1 [Rattus norvegicus]